MSISSLIQQDLAHHWHPCAQMKDYETFHPLEIERAQGSLIYLKNGQPIIDAISSWWCKSLGHGHPILRQALIDQAQRFTHVISANTTHDAIAACSEKLSQLTPHLSKVMYASDGSCAVEIALKMAVHAQQHANRPERTQFMALQNGYHGETALTLSVSDVGLYKAPYHSLLTPVPLIQQIPYVSNQNDPLWSDCSASWPAIETQLNQQADTLAAIIVEPILQGACGMHIYSADFLRRLAAWCKQHNIYLIADEILTGFYRTGQALACQHAGVEADFVCVSKGLTSGMIPMSATLTSQHIYDLFYDDYDTQKAFLHSHTHSGNALGAAVACATLDIMATAAFQTQVNTLSKQLEKGIQRVSEATGVLKNIRHLGAMVAADYITNDNSPKRLGYQIYQQAIKRGALLRPIGNTIYWLPPLNTATDVIDQLTEISIAAIKAGYQHS